MKKSILVLLLIFILIFTLSCAFLFLKNQKYSISDITADNYQKILKENRSISLADPRNGIDNFFSQPPLLYDPKIAAYPQEISVNFYPEFYPKISTVSIEDKVRQRLYSMYYPDNSFKKLNGIMLTGSPMSQGLAGAEEELDNLIKKFEYTFKESALKSGDDIIIQELPDNFTIISIYRNSFKMVSMLNFHIYSRYKFFQ